MKKSVLAAAALLAGVLSAPAQAATFTYTGAGGSLPDLVNFSSSVTVANNFAVQDVNVVLNNLTHTFWADLEIRLVRGATTVYLTNDNGGGTDPNGTYTFDDEASLSVASLSPTPGSYQPLQMLSAFDGANSAGVWTLHIVDDAGVDAGQLASWSLVLTGSGVPEPASWAMMLAGLGLVGGAMRRKTSKLATA